MAEIILARHAESYANKRDFAAFGNKESPLTDHGKAQTKRMNQTFSGEFGIVTEDYIRPVLASSFVRTQQTARLVGFNVIHISPKIDEARVDEEVMSGISPVYKHATERWVPDSLKQPVVSFLDDLQEGRLNYEIYFTHGMFIAGLVLECEARGIDHGMTFDAERGYVPLQATLVKLVL